MFEKLRQHLFDRDFKKQLQTHRSKRRSMPLENARYVGILFDGTELDARKPVLAFAKRLKKEGKRVKLLAFMDNKVDNSNFPFESFNRKDLSWYYTPKSESALRFMEEPFDILINLNLSPSPWMNYIAALSAARFRVGTAEAAPEACDLMLDMSKGGGAEKFIREAERYLQKMQTRRHEVSTP